MFLLPGNAVANDENIRTHPDDIPQRAIKIPAVRLPGIAPDQVKMLRMGKSGNAALCRPSSFLTDPAIIGDSAFGLRLLRPAMMMRRTVIIVFPAGNGKRFPVCLQHKTILVVMPMLRNRKEKKRLDEYNRTIAAIQPGNKVITVGGICGEVAETADEKTFVLKTGAQDGRASLITLQREAIWWTDAKPAGEPQGDGSDTAGTDEVTESKVEPAPAYPARERGEYPKEADHIQPGNKVVTVGGIEGEAVEVKEESGTIVLKTGGDSYVEVDKGAVRWTDAAIPETPAPEAADPDTAEAASPDADASEGSGAAESGEEKPAEETEQKADGRDEKENKTE